MGDLYGLALEVVIWLGEDRERMACCFSRMKYLDGQHAGLSWAAESWGR
jgi:hypothetical protein